MLTVVPSASLTCLPFQSQSSETFFSQPLATRVANRWRTVSDSLARALQYPPLLLAHGCRPNATNSTITRETAAKQDRCSSLCKT